MDNLAEAHLKSLRLGWLKDAKRAARHLQTEVDYIVSGLGVGDLTGTEYHASSLKPDTDLLLSCLLRLSVADNLTAIFRSEEHSEGKLGSEPEECKRLRACCRGSSSHRSSQAYLGDSDTDRDGFSHRSLVIHTSYDRAAGRVAHHSARGRIMPEVISDRVICLCGHLASDHEHFREGTDCGDCLCPRFQSAQKRDRLLSRMLDRYWLWCYRIKSS